MISKAAFEAENQQYLSWERKMQGSKRALLTAKEPCQQQKNPNKEPCH